MTQPGPGPYGGGPPHGSPYGYPGGAGAPPPRPPPPKKKSNVPLLIALGCGGLLAFSAAAAAAGYFFVLRPAQRALDDLPDITGSSLPSGFPIPPLPPAAGPGVAPDLGAPSSAGAANTGVGGTPGSTDTARPSPPRSGAGGAAAGTGGAPASAGAAGAGTAGSAAGSTGAGGPTCTLAAQCCRVIVSRSPASAPGIASNCDNLRLLTESVCQQQLQTYRQAAQLLGASCP